MSGAWGAPGMGQRVTRVVHVAYVFAVPTVPKINGICGTSTGAAPFVGPLTH